MALKLDINGKTYQVDVEVDMPLLWVLRDELAMTSVKYGCGIAQCGACTVYIDGQPVRSCAIAASQVEGAITTIEDRSNTTLKIVQQAWIEHQVAQCGYCQSGQIMAAAALLDINPSPSNQDIDAYMSANLCRCGTYPRIRQAIKAAASKLADESI